MGIVTIRVRSIVWFITGALLATTVLVVFAAAWRADAAPGDTDTTFVPITPCRLADTRPVGIPALVPQETRTFQVHGSNGDCTIPAEATAVSMNVTAEDATVGTFWTFWPADESQPLASSLNPFPGQPPTPNAVSTPLSAGGAFNLFNFTGSVNAIIDIDGYYTRTSLQDLAARVTANESNIAANTGKIASLDAREPFVVNKRINSPVIAGSSATEIVNVTMTAPATGHVTVVTSGEFSESTDGHTVECSVLESVVAATGTRWQSPTGGDTAHLSVNAVFEIAAGQIVTYYLVCSNRNGSSSTIWNPQMAAIYTPAP